MLVALQWTLRFFDELSTLERHVWGTFVEGDRTTIALGGKGVIVPGCEASRKRIGTNSQYLRHLADDMLPAIFSGCAQRRELSAALGLKAFALLRRKQSREIHVDLAKLAVGTGHRYAITSHRARRAANEVIAFVRGENEQRIL